MQSNSLFSGTTKNQTTKPAKPSKKEKELVIADIVRLSSGESSSSSSSSSSSNNNPQGKQGRIFFISDVHGMCGLLKNLLGGKLKDGLKFTREDTIIFCGDLIDRADDLKDPDDNSTNFSSYALVEYVMQLVEQHAQGKDVPLLRPLAGNHEKMFLCWAARKYFPEAIPEMKRRFDKYFSIFALSYSGYGVKILSSKDGEQIKEWLADEENRNIESLLVYKEKAIDSPVCEKKEIDSDDDTGLRSVPSSAKEDKYSDAVVTSSDDELGRSSHDSGRWFFYGMYKEHHNKPPVFLENESVQRGTDLYNFLHGYTFDSLVEFASEKTNELALASSVSSYLKYVDNNDRVDNIGSSWAVYEEDIEKIKKIFDYIYTLPSIIFSDDFIAVHATLPQGLALKDGGMLTPDQHWETSWKEIKNCPGCYSDIAKKQLIVYCGHRTLNGVYDNYFNIDADATLTWIFFLVNHTDKKVYLCDDDGLAVVPHERSLTQAMLLRLFERLPIRKVCGGNLNFFKKEVPWYAREHGEALIRRFLQEIIDPSSKADFIVALLSKFKESPKFFKAIRCFFDKWLYCDAAADSIIKIMKTNNKDKDLFESFKSFYTAWSSGNEAVQNYSACLQYAITKLVLNAFATQLLNMEYVIENFDGKQIGMKSEKFRKLTKDEQDCVMSVNSILHNMPKEFLKNFKSICVLLALLKNAGKQDSDTKEKDFSSIKVESFGKYSADIVENMITILTTEIVYNKNSMSIYRSMLEVLLKFSTDAHIQDVIHLFIREDDEARLKAFLNIIKDSLGMEKCEKIASDSFCRYSYDRKKDGVSEILEILRNFTSLSKGSNCSSSNSSSSCSH